MKRSYWVLKAVELSAIFLVFTLIEFTVAKFLLCLVGLVVVNVCGWVEGKNGPWGRS